MNAVISKRHKNGDNKGYGDMQKHELTIDESISII